MAQAGPPPRILSTEDRATLAVIVRWQRFLLWGVLLNIAITVGIRFEPLLVIPGLVVVLGLIVVLANLSRSIGYGVVTRILLCLGLFIPIVSLLILLTVNGRATKILKSNGIPVGLMGARANCVTPST